MAISVTLPNGAHKHIKFLPRSGGSVYYSSDESEQMALESHRSFGKAFKLMAEPAAAPMSAASVAKKAAAQAVSAEKKVSEIKVSDLAAAKDYLCDRFGLSRTKLRSQKAIEDAAKENGIVFIGI